MKSTEMDRVYLVERNAAIERYTERQQVQDYYRNIDRIMDTAEFRREYNDFLDILNKEAKHGQESRTT